MAFLLKKDWQDFLLDFVRIFGSSNIGYDLCNSIGPGFVIYSSVNIIKASTTPDISE